MQLTALSVLAVALVAVASAGPVFDRDGDHLEINPEGDAMVEDDIVAAAIGTLQTVLNTTLENNRAGLVAAVNAVTQAVETNGAPVLTPSVIRMAILGDFSGGFDVAPVAASMAHSANAFTTSIDTTTVNKCIFTGRAYFTGTGSLQFYSLNDYLLDTTYAIDTGYSYELTNGADIYYPFDCVGAAYVLKSTVELDVNTFLVLVGTS